MDRKLQHHSLSVINAALCEPNWTEAFSVFLAEVSCMTWTHTQPTARPADADRVCECQSFLYTVSQTGRNSCLARCGSKSPRSQWQKTSIHGDSASFLLLENVKRLIWKASWLPSQEAFLCKPSLLFSLSSLLCLILSLLVRSLKLSSKVRKSTFPGEQTFSVVKTQSSWNVSIGLLCMC